MLLSVPNGLKRLKEAGRLSACTNVAVLCNISIERIAIQYIFGIGILFSHVKLA